jgi:dihydrofolate synthase/folylpolyglutamate synthase
LYHEDRLAVNQLWLVAFSAEQCTICPVSDYQQALDWIYSFANWETRTAAGGALPEWDLARVEGALATIGNPHCRYPTVHVAGTKGKGSTAAMLASVLHAAGYRTGLYTSPHLHTFRERIQIDGHMISEPELVELVQRFRPIAEGVADITTFEVVTIMAFDYFAAQRVDIAVIEVGLGGRLDATNVITPRVSVITSLSFDHIALLGDTLPQIATEKAGIIKPGVPVVSAPQPPDALAVLERIATERNTPLVLVGRDWIWRAGRISLEGQEVEICRGDAEIGGHGDTKTRGSSSHRVTASPRPPCSQLWIPLLGRHQLVNATTAVAAIDVLRSYRPEVLDSALGREGARYAIRSTFDVSDAALHAGLAVTRWPGRLEILSRQPLVVVDGAHNAESARRLVEALDEWFGQRRRFLVFGASFDKDIDGMLDALVPGAECLVLARSRHPRRAQVEDLMWRVAQRGGEALVCADVATALERALELAGPDDLVCVTGSLFVVAEAREAWLTRIGDLQLECDPPLPTSVRTGV